MRLKKIISIILLSNLMMSISNLTIFASDDWECQNCRTKNSGNYCTNCGNSKDNTWICSKCGEESSGDSCEFCGQKNIKYSNTSVGDIVTYGTYEQNYITSDGEEDIKWIVLDIQGDEALLLSKYGLDAKPYNDEKVDITWEKCTLRQWLNNDFMNAAFSEEEQTGIVLTAVVNDDNAQYDVEGGNDTQDYIFCLSLDEANQYFGSFSMDYDRVCYPTIYAIEYGAWTSEGDSTWWWLRSPGCATWSAAYISSKGSLTHYGGHVLYDKGSVRPALWVKISNIEQ